MALSKIKEKWDERMEGKEGRKETREGGLGTDENHIDNVDLKGALFRPDVRKEIREYDC